MYKNVISHRLVNKRNARSMCAVIYVVEVVFIRSTILSSIIVVVVVVVHIVVIM